jgi:hypothetical protein
MPTSGKCHRYHYFPDDDDKRISSRKTIPSLDIKNPRE